MVAVENMNLSTDQLYLLILEQALQNAKIHQRRCVGRVNEADLALHEAQNEVYRLTNEIEFRRAEMLKRGCV